MKRSLMTAVILSSLVALASGCDPVFEKDATFKFKGSVSNSAGSAVVLGTDAEIEICGNVTYDILDGNHVLGSNTDILCRDLVTSQTGTYAIDTKLSTRVTNEAYKIQVKNVKLFARKKVMIGSTTTYYVMPAKISNVETRADGANVEADIIIMDF
jgi:hypothetical protein